MTSVAIPRDEPDGRLSPGRRIGGFAVAVVGVLATSIGLLPDRERVGLESVLLVFVLVSVVASAIGGVLPAVTAAVLGFFSANLLFTPPYNTLYVQYTGHLVDLILFLGIAAGVGLLVEASSRARLRAARARALAAAIAELDRHESGDHDNVDRLLIDILDRLGMDRAELAMDHTPVAVAGIPEGGAIAARIPAGNRLELRLYGSELHGTDAELLAAFGNTAGRLWRGEQLAARAAGAEERARTAQLRGDRLAGAVEDLPQPLAELRAGVSTIRGEADGLTPEGLRELALVEGQLDRLIADLRDSVRVPADSSSSPAALR
ncbi:MAG: DUF4118 domain-containing protein [Actinobacteria bacterium]|nr:DUF4118 domain-containing protein [Actinomycetota bacterium]